MKEKKWSEIKSPECERPRAHTEIPSGLHAQRECLSERRSARVRNHPCVCVCKGGNAYVWLCMSTNCTQSLSNVSAEESILGPSVSGCESVTEVTQQGAAGHREVFMKEDGRSLSADLSRV